jgi:hypothetical protein
MDIVRRKEKGKDQDNTRKKSNNACTIVYRPPMYDEVVERGPNKPGLRWSGTANSAAIEGDEGAWSGWAKETNYHRQ